MVDKRVGFMTTSILEDIVRDGMLIAWKNKDYKTFNEYMDKYISLRSYNALG